MLPPHSFATTYANNELFQMLRQGPQGIEYLRQSFALTRPEFEARRAAGLSIVVSPYATDPSSYVITVTITDRTPTEIFLLSTSPYYWMQEISASTRLTCRTKWRESQANPLKSLSFRRANQFKWSGLDMAFTMNTTATMKLQSI